MSKLDDLLYSYRGDVEFLDDMRRGKFDAEKGKLVAEAIKELIDKIKECDLEEKWEIANLCEVFYYVGITDVENNWNNEIDMDLEAFDNDLHGIISELYPDEMML